MMTLRGVIGACDWCSRLGTMGWKDGVGRNYVCIGGGLYIDGVGLEGGGGGVI